MYVTRFVPIVGTGDEPILRVEEIPPEARRAGEDVKRSEWKGGGRGGFHQKEGEMEKMALSWTEVFCLNKLADLEGIKGIVANTA